VKLPSLLPLSALALSLAALVSCRSARTAPLRTVPQVDLPRFMGDWYIIANIPTFIEKGAHNAIESYRLDPDGSIATTFTFRQGGFEGPAKRYTPRGFVFDRASNAIWGMRFVWPIKADYRIIHLTPDYAQTIVAREKRDYLWIMARTPSISEADYQTLLKVAEAQGYDPRRIQRVPQRWE
jgi:apolipoprotein D and lipocalin family protein